MKSSNIGDIAEEIFAESYGTVGNLVPEEPITKKIPCPEKTKNKVKIPPRFKGSPFDSSVEKDYYKNETNCFDEDEEDFETDDQEIQDVILQQYEGIGPRTNGMALSDILGYFSVSDGVYPKNEVMRVLQDMINKNILEIDPITKKIFKSLEEDEEDEFITPEEITDEEKGNDLIDSVIDYFEQSTSGSVGGINLSQILKDVTSNTGASRAEVVQAIKDLLQSNILKKGVTEGTIILNSTSKTDEVEEDAEGPIPVINQETPETLRAKGWTETAPGIFVGPDGVQKYALTGESYNTKLNKHMSNFNDDNFSKLCEEFEKEFDKVDVSLDDSTEGLDEFADETEVSDEEGETMTMEIPRHLVDAITELAAIFSDSEDEPVDDLATDEEATIDLMDGDGDEAEVSIEETDEDEESAKGCEDDEEFNFDEDEETIADTAGSIFDASFGPNEGGASVTKASTTLPEKRRKPIEGAYRPNAGGQAYDASTRNGGASVTKATTTFNKSGKPITSKVSQKAKSKNSIFDL